MTVQKYRKKPVVIEADEVPTFIEGSSIVSYSDSCIAVANWCGGISYMMVNEGEKAFADALITGPYIAIPTLEGVMAARPGDFVIKGVNGEFYPCKPDIFEKTYEAADGN